MVKLGAAAVLLCLGFAGSAPAQRSDDPSGDVTFRTGTELVQVDVIVKKDGKPVDDLTKEDFTLTDNGTPQTISVFNLRRAEPVGGPEPPLPPGVVTNLRVAENKAPVSGTVILLDFINAPPQGATNTPLAGIAYALQQAIQYVEHAELTEYVAVYSINQTVKQLQDFTTDREKLLGVLKQIKPQQTQDFRDRSEYFDYRRKIEMLRAAFFTLSRYLKGVPGRKKLLWVTSGVKMTTTEAISETRAAEGMQFLPEYFNQSSILEDPIAILNDANIGVYPLDPTGLPKDLKDPTIAVMNFFADRTGGQAQYMLNQRNLAEAMGRVMRDTEITYTLGYYIPEDAQAGEHDLRVRVDRPGVEVRYRRGYTAVPTPDPLDADARFKTLSAWMVEPLDATDIVMRARAVPVSEDPGSFDVTVAIDPLSLNLELRDGRFRGLIDVAIVPDTGKKPVGMHQSILLNLEQADYLQAAQTGILIERRINALNRKGKLSADDLRVGVVDGMTGKIGTVRVPIALPE